MKVLITDRLHKTITEEKSVFDQHNISIVDKYSHNEEELIENGKGCIGFLVSYAQITRRVMEALPDLKIIVKYGVGVNNIDVEAATELGKVVANVPDYCMEEVASQALMLALNGLKHARSFSNEVVTGLWADDPSEKIIYRPSSVTAGVIGFGRIARQFATYAKALFGEVLFFDPYFPDDEFSGCRKIEDLGELFEKCKVISTHAPLTRETERMVSSSVISKAESAILVNTGRADVIDKVAVEQGLDNGNLDFFGADTYWPEPPAYAVWDKAFLARENVMITPHCGWCSKLSERDVRRNAARSIVEMAQGRKPESALN